LDCPDWVLAEINTLSKMSSVRFRIFVAQIISYCLMGELNYEKIIKIAEDNSEGLSNIKGAVAAIHFIITSAAKYDVEDNALIQEIQQLGLPKENSETVAKQYRENKDNLRDQLEKSSYRISRLLDCSWRVDQVLAASDSSSAGSIVSQKVVNLRMTVDSRPGVMSGNKIEDLAFEVSPENLDMLILELAQAQQMMNEIDA
jgi:DNA polymerase III delta prime subunit